MTDKSNPRVKLLEGVYVGTIAYVNGKIVDGELKYDGLKKECRICSKSLQEPPDGETKIHNEVGKCGCIFHNKCIKKYQSEVGSCPKCHTPYATKNANITTTTRVNNIFKT